MGEEKVVVELDQYEHRAVVNIINEKRTNLINENEDNDFISEILEKVINAKKKKTLFKKEKDRNER